MPQLPIVRIIPNDDPEAKAWLESNVEKNRFEERMLKYPCLRLLQAENDGVKQALLPVHPVLMLDSMATKGNVISAGKAMRELVKAACSEALRNGIQELMFMVSDEVTAEAAEDIGFVESKARWYVLKLPLAEELK